MLRALVVCLGLILPSVLLSQHSEALITPDEFGAIEIRENVSCANTWLALRAVEHLTKFDPKRFGGNAILKQVALKGCEEFVIFGADANRHGKIEISGQLVGQSERAVVKKAQTLLEQDVSGGVTEMSKQRLDKSVCVSFSLSNADDLGILLYGFIAEKPSVTFPLYEKVEEKTWRCDRDLWEHAIPMLK